MAQAGHYQAKAGTRQGIYVCTPNGRLLNSCNSLDPDVVLNMLSAGLAAWKSVPDSERTLENTAAMRADPRWEWNYPEEGLVLRSSQRDLPPNGSPEEERLPRFNLDHVWFAKDEALGFLPQKIEVGATRTVSKLLTERLARFHLVDNVRGQTLPFSSREVADSNLQSEIVAIENGLVQLQISGDIRSVSDGTWDMGDNIWKPEGRWPRRIKAHALGRASFSIDSGKFESFELVALGQHFGRTKLNGRQADTAGPIGFSFVLASDSPSDHVAPGFIQVYDAPWVLPLEKAKLGVCATDGGS